MSCPVKSPERERGPSAVLGPRTVITHTSGHRARAACYLERRRIAPYSALTLIQNPVRRQSRPALQGALPDHAGAPAELGQARVDRSSVTPFRANLASQNSGRVDGMRKR